MPGTRCTVAVCNNSFEKTKRAGINITYHQFPRTQPLRDIWIERCRRAGKWNPSSCHVCSIHFTEDDYRRDISCEILNVPGKRRLKATAIPTLFLTQPPPLGLITLSQRKREKLSIDKEEPMYFNDNEAVYYQTDDTNTQDIPINDMPIYEVYQTEDSNEDIVPCMKEYENNHTETTDTDSLECFYVVDEENEEVEEEYSPSSHYHCITVSDCSTQTDTDYFLENYKLLVDKNESLESELVRWNNRYKKLMSTTKFLENKIQMLTLTSQQSQQS